MKTSRTSTNQWKRPTAADRPLREHCFRKWWTPLTALGRDRRGWASTTQVRYGHLVLEVSVSNALLEMVQPSTRRASERKHTEWAAEDGAPPTGGLPAFRFGLEWKLCGARAFVDGHPERYLQLIRDVCGTDRMTLVGLETLHRLGDAEKLMREGMRALRKLSAAGRPKRAITQQDRELVRRVTEIQNRTAKTGHRWSLERTLDHLQQERPPVPGAHVHPATFRKIARAVQSA